MIQRGGNNAAALVQEGVAHEQDAAASVQEGVALEQDEEEELLDLPDCYIDPTTQDPPAMGCRFLCPGRDGRTNNQVFELSPLIEYIKSNRSAPQTGLWRTHVKHPMEDIWCDGTDFLRYIKAVTDEEQELFTSHRIRSGLNEVDHPVSLDQIKFISNGQKV